LAAAQNNAVSGETVQEVMDRLQHADANYLFEEIPKAIDQSLEV